jgi:dienelactone hydrolase
MSLSSCCGKGFEWDGTPEGKVIPFPTASNQAYITGSHTDAAVMLIPDLFGWEYPNIRLLADHLAREAEVTVYVPDLYTPQHSILPTAPSD